MTVDDIVMTLMATPEGRRNPYPHYEQLRAVAPVARSGIGGLWFLTGFDDCHNVLRDPRFGKADPDAPLTLLPGAAPRRRLRFAGKTMLLVDPPDHTRLRGLVSREFTPRRVERLRDGVERMCDELLDDIADAGEVDLMDTLAFPLPVRVIGELLGVPEEDRDGFRPLVLAAAKSIEPDMTEEEFAAADAAGQQQANYFTQLIADRTAHPEDDLLSALIAVRDGTDRLDEEELIATAILLFAAGFETTTNLIGNGIATLLQHPDQLALLRSDPSLLASAVDEILRVESPVQLDLRIAFDAVDLADQHIEAGDAVVTMLGAANRDPAKTPEPDRFDITRGDIPLMSFATGIHYCLGANLARMEGRVVLQRLLDRFHTIELLDDEPAWRDRLTLRGLDHLNVRCA